MSLYAQFETNPSLEKTGIFIEYGTNSKGKETRFKVARMGGANEAYTKRVEALVRPHRRAIQNETVDHGVVRQINKQAFIDACLLGWEGVEDREGNEIPFSKAAAYKLFEDLPDLYDDLREQAAKVVLFRQQLLEDSAKN